MRPNRNLLALAFSLSLAGTALTAAPFLTNNFDLAKHLTYGIGVILTVGVLYVSVVRNRSIELNWSLHDLLPALFLILVNVSALNGVSPFVSRHGSYGHFLGAIFFGAAFLTYLLAKQIYSSNEVLTKLLKVLNYTLLIASSYAILQSIGLDPLVYGSEDLGVHGAFATFSDPGHLAGFLVLTLPIALSLYLYQRRQLFNIYLFTWLSGVAALGLTLNVAGWFCWLLSTVILLGLARKKGQARALKLIVLAVSSFVVLSAAVLALGASEPGRQSLSLSLKNVQAQVIRTADQNRLGLQIAYLSIDDRPFTGYGPDSFIYAFYKNETAESARYFKGEQKFDNAHNYFLQLIVTLGWPAAAAFTVFLTLMFFYALKRVWFRSGDVQDLRIDLALLGAVLAYVLFLKFSTEDYASLLIMWALLGAVSGRSKSVRRLQVEVFTPGFNMRKNTVYIGMILLAAGIFQGFVERGTYISADRTFKQAVGGSLEPGSVEERGAYRNAASKFKGTPAPYYLFAEAKYLNKLALDTSSADLNLVAINSAERSVQADPFEVEYRLLLANIYADQAAVSEGDKQEQFVRKAEQKYREVIKQSPNFRSAHISYGLLLIASERYAPAINELNIAIKLNPGHLPVYYFLGLAHEGTGNTEQALSNYKRAVKDPQFGEEAGLAIQELDGGLSQDAADLNKGAASGH